MSLTPENSSSSGCRVRVAGTSLIMSLMLVIKLVLLPWPESEALTRRLAKQVPTANWPSGHETALLPKHGGLQVSKHCIVV